ncbi:MBL fold metallo-hydrolase [Actibacterium ureilyticum]|uniref:MBL fold metallo-hydrolase n=1 Tax=Actibacterium ureilyticum TaxID=1590614 RepID=UPI000BAAF747|nr:MBL fold metallo-hydrolase [Actibacterium ureilyticum]
MTLSRRHFLTAGASLPLAGLLGASTARAKAPLAGVQTAGIHRTLVGQAEVTALLDGYVDVATQLLSRFDSDEVDAAFSSNGYKTLDKGLRIPVNGYLINTGDRLVLLDTGAASLFGPTLGSLAANLKAAGVAPADIDLVVLTHLHVDHVGGLLDGSGQAMFPNAELVVAQTEWDFWHDDAMMAAAGEGAAAFFQAARNTTAPYANRLKLFDGEVDLGAGLSTMPLPGHTPGHTGYLLSSGDDALLFWGDVIHLTGLQFTHPEITIAFDTDPAMVKQTRARMLDMAAADGLSVTGAHLDFPGFGQVMRAGDAYRFQQAPWRFTL